RIPTAFNATRDTSMILSSFEDAVKTYDLTWGIDEASEASTRELHGSVLPSVTLGTTSAKVPASLESSKTSPVGPTSTDSAPGKGGKALMESVKEGVGKL